MTWLAINASVVGTSHVASNKPCEDSSLVLVDTNKAGQRVLSLIVSDGAGSALHGGEGAELAVASTGQFIKGLLKLPEIGLHEELAVDLLTHVRQDLFKVSARKACLLRDLACTLIVVIGTHDKTLCLQVGDGAAVVDLGSGLELALNPMNDGEYANMTHFITQDDAVGVMGVKVFNGGIKRAAVLSDGLQRLALNLANHTPHAPFFDRFFSVMGKSTLNDLDGLTAALEAFLNTPVVNERTDDDKSLALAIELGPRKPGSVIETVA